MDLFELKLACLATTSSIEPDLRNSIEKILLEMNMFCYTDRQGCVWLEKMDDCLLSYSKKDLERVATIIRNLDSRCYYRQSSLEGLFFLYYKVKQHLTDDKTNLINSVYPAFVVDD